MANGKLLIIVSMVFGLAGLVVGSLLLLNEPQQDIRPGVSAAIKNPTSLGITYLPVTQELSEYYDLGVSYGDLITDISRGSSFDVAGIKAGDVILSFNGATPEDPVSLLGMMMTCPAGTFVTLEIWRQHHAETVQFFHSE